MSKAAPAPAPVSAVDEYKRQANELLDAIDAKLQAYPLIVQVSSKTTLRPSHLTVGVFVFLVTFVFYGFGGRLVSNLVGFAWPLWESFESLKRKAAPGVVDESDRLWLTYWVVYSTFTLVESATDALALWIPLYHIVKIVFLLWCMLPQTRGALLIYSSVIEPLLVRYEGKIDSQVARVRRGADVVADDLADVGGDVISSSQRDLAQGVISSIVSGQREAMQQAQAAPGGPEPDEEEEADHTKSL